MIASTGAKPVIERYLGRVRVALRGLPEREVDDILRELRSHVDELVGKEGSGVEAALQSLGDPVDLAQTYRPDNEIVRARCSDSPLIILQGLRRASRGTLGRATATALYVFGYSTMVMLWVEALEKLLARSRGGNPPSGARELLGWWVVPIALLAGWGIKYASDRSARWWIGRHRRSQATQEI